MSAQQIATHAPLVYTPEFWDPAKAYTNYVPDLEGAKIAGRAYAVKYGLDNSAKLLARCPPPRCRAAHNVAPSQIPAGNIFAPAAQSSPRPRPGPLQSFQLQTVPWAKSFGGLLANQSEDGFKFPRKLADALRGLMRLVQQDFQPLLRRLRAHADQFGGGGDVRQPAGDIMAHVTEFLEQLEDLFLAQRDRPVRFVIRSHCSIIAKAGA